MQQYIKNFDQWNKEKKIIDSITNQQLFQEREIWWCSIGENIGYEQNGKHTHFERPVLILRKYNTGLFLGVALTSKAKKNRFHHEITPGSFAILSQIRTYSAKRLIRKMKKTTSKQFDEVVSSIKKLNL